MRHAGIAFDSGSVPEIIENKITGFVVSNIDEAASAVGRNSTLRHEGDGAGMTVFRPAA